MCIIFEEIECRLKRLESYDKPRADEIRKYLSASVVPPVIIDDEGPFWGCIKVELPVST